MGCGGPARGSGCRRFEGNRRREAQWTSPATSGRSWPTSVSSATGPMPGSVRASCGWTTAMTPRPRRRRAARRSCPASSTRASSISGSLADDPEERMPPAKSGKSLSPAEIARLKTWIEQGAEYQEHWAFVPPVRPALPAVKNAGWCRNPIDVFILARLEAEGLAPSPEADKVTLDPPAQPRPDRPAADDRGGRRLPGRHPRRRLRPAGRAAARLAALRRALGADLARRRALCRLRRLREGQVAPGLCSTATGSSMP